MEGAGVIHQEGPFAIYDNGAEKLYACRVCGRWNDIAAVRCVECGVMGPASPGRQSVVNEVGTFAEIRAD